MASEDKVGTLEQEALKRKERLKAWKRKRDGDDSDGQSEEKSDGQPEEKSGPLPAPKFRSYRPLDEKLKENVIEDAKPCNIEDHVKDQLQSANTKVILDDLDITKLAPRKPDADLKRDVAKKLETLERRTKRAIAELVLERLRESQEADLANAVTTGGAVQQQNVDD